MIVEIKGNIFCFHNVTSCFFFALICSFLMSSCILFQSKCVVVLYLKKSDTANLLASGIGSVLLIVHMTNN
jgi:hypothetical protein